MEDKNVIKKWISKWYRQDGEALFLTDSNDLKQAMSEGKIYDTIYLLDYKFEQGQSQIILECKSLLNDNGSILIACFNRLGLRFFAGAPEEASNTYFEGLMDYPNATTKYSFSRSEWCELLDGMDCNYRFYYPYPEHIHPVEIFTDCNVNNGSYGKPVFNQVSRRYELFNEHKVFQALSKDGVIQNFANSFLIEINPKSEFKEYTKYSVDRKDAFKISTSIIHGNDGRFVIKRAESDQAINHIRDVAQKSSLEEKHLNVGQLISDDAIKYEFIEKRNLDDIIFDLYKKNDKEAIGCLIDSFYKILLESSAEIDYRSDEFAVVFGDADLSDEKVMCVTKPNVDLIFDNVFVLDESRDLTKDNITVIDGEWLFDFPIPVGFLFWRALNELYGKHVGFNSLVTREELARKYNITELDEAVYKDWNRGFTLKYVGAGTIPEDIVAVDLLSLNDLRWQRGPGKRIMSNFYWKNADMDEYGAEHMSYKEATLLGDNVYEVLFEVPDDAVGSFRIDLVQGAWDAVEIIETLCVKEIRPNERNYPVGVYTAFLDKVATYYLIPDDLAEAVSIKFRIKDVTDSKNEILEDYYRNQIDMLNRELHAKAGTIANKNECIQGLEAQLHAIYDSKAWRLVSFVRRHILHRK
ncbi:MAG: hypothetical protein J6O60_02945 [Lachnospiraceae bacterium]|nr:hypothetical protein [Lachnospiraceae bacterium]